MKAKCSARCVLAGLIALPVLAACGLRGGLERPDPLFRDLPQIEEPEPVVETPQEEPEVIIRQRFNEYGGEIPEAAPVEEVLTEPLGELETDDETDPEDEQDTDNE